MANAINWFEIPVTDMGRAKKFYESVLGVELALNNMDNAEMAWFPMEQNATGATGSLIKAETYEPSYKGSMVYFSVESIEKALEQVNKGGGKTLNPKMSIGEFGFVAHFEDTEGNRVALHSVQ